MGNTNDGKKFLPPEIVRQLRAYSVQYEQEDTGVRKIYQELNAFVDDYLKNRSVEQEPDLFMEVVNRLPPCKTRREIEDRIDDLFARGKIKRWVRGTQSIPAEVLQRLNDFSGQLKSRHKNAARINREINKIVWPYLEENGLMKNKAALLETISCLPGCYCRFLLYERYYELEEIDESHSSDTKKQKKKQENCR